MLTTVMIAQLLVVQPTMADAAADWRKVFENQLGITAVRKVSSFPGVNLARPLNSCPALSPLQVASVTAFNLGIDAGAGRRTDIDVWIGELPAGVNAHASVISAGRGFREEDWSCTLTKRGVSFLQIGRFWIALPTLCRKGNYQNAVAIVLAALHRVYQREFPSDFIYGACGDMKVRPSDTAAFLRRAAGLPSNKALQRPGADGARR